MSCTSSETSTIPAPVTAESSGLFDDPYANQVKLEQILLSGEVSAQTHQTIEHEIDVAHSVPSNPKLPSSTNTTVALLLGSPEFQRR